jgi:Flp pilus assembly protein TadD
MTAINQKKLEQFKKGELKFTQIFNLDRSQIASLMLCGHNLFSQGRLEEARCIFEGLTLLDPALPYPHCILGAIYQRMKKYDVAILRYTRAIELFPQDIVSITNRAEIYLNQGKFLEAAKDLKTVIELDPHKKDVTANRARVLAAMTAEELRQTKQKSS